MQRWKLIIIFTRPGDNYRPTVPEEFVDGVPRQERGTIGSTLARKEGIFRTLFMRHVERRLRGGGQGWGRSYRISWTRIAALLTLFAATRRALARMHFCHMGVRNGAAIRPGHSARPRFSVFAKRVWYWITI